MRIDAAVASVGWILFKDGGSFASLFGGTTVPEHRNRGLYSSLVARTLGAPTRRALPHCRFSRSSAFERSLVAADRYGGQATGISRISEAVGTAASIGENRKPCRSVSGRSVAWSTRLSGGQEIAGSNPVGPKLPKLSPAMICEAFVFYFVDLGEKRFFEFGN